MQDLYRQPNFGEDLRGFFLGPRARWDMPLPFSSISVWDRVRVQLKDPQDKELVLPAITFVADPSCAGDKGDLGRFNFVLLHDEIALEGLDDFGIRGECCRNLIAGLSTSMLM